MAFLDVNGLSQVLGKKDILNNISLQADAGKVVVLLGPNGAGKTTLLKSIIGLHPVRGEKNSNQAIVFNGINITKLPVYKRVELGLLYLPQHSSLFQHMTVYDNLLVVYQYHAVWNNKSQQEFDAAAEHWLTITNLTHAKQQAAGTLSGGQKRKLEVVRSLLMKPRMLLLDEPFAGVDPKSIYELKAIFTQLATDGIGIVISDHHVDQLLSIAHMVYVIVSGSVVSKGTIKEILENTYTKENYLGTQFYEEMAQRFLRT